MKNFIIFFEGKEGTTPLVNLLNNFEKVSIVHQAGGIGWEPLDRYHCGPMSQKNLERCLDLIYNPESVDMEQLNQIYLKTGKNPLEVINPQKAVGFKMRFNPPKQNFGYVSGFDAWNNLSSRVFQSYHEKSFRNMMIETLARNNVTVFFAIRQDIMRWALSKYHGDGTGKPGHLQFKLAGGKIRREDISKINVDSARLKRIINKCEEFHTEKRKLIEDLKAVGVQSYPICYEDFLADKHQYFKRFFDCLNIEISAEEIDTALNQGTKFQKVHSEDISSFVENHEEILEQFSDRFIAWT